MQVDFIALELIPGLGLSWIFASQIFIFQIGVRRMGALWWLEEGRGGASTHPRGEKEKEEEEEHPSEEEEE